LIDAPRSVRPGEELDLDAVGEYLVGIDPGLAGPLEVSQFRAGASNLTYLVRVGGRELVLRRPPHGRKARSAHDMGREVRMLGALADVYPYVPRVIAHCEDPAVMGCDFYVMERIEGIILRKNLANGLRLSRSDVATLCRNVVNKLIETASLAFADESVARLGVHESNAKGVTTGDIDGDGWIEITLSGDGLSGIVRGSPNGSDDRPDKDEKNPDPALRGRPLTGLDQIFAVDGEARALAADTIMKYDASVRGSEIRC